MNKNESLDNPEGLTLPLLSGNQPFALSEEEKLLGLDDKARLFLSLNDGYRPAYPEYRSEYDLQPHGHVPSKKAPCYLDSFLTRVIAK